MFLFRTAMVLFVIIGIVAAFSGEKTARAATQTFRTGWYGGGETLVNVRFSETVTYLVNGYASIDNLTAEIDVPSVVCDGLTQSFDYKVVDGINPVATVVNIPGIVNLPPLSDKNVVLLQAKTGGGIKVHQGVSTILFGVGLTSILFPPGVKFNPANGEQEITGPCSEVTHTKIDLLSREEMYDFQDDFVLGIPLAPGSTIQSSNSTAPAVQTTTTTSNPPTIGQTVTTSSSQTSNSSSNGNTTSSTNQSNPVVPSDPPPKDGVQVCGATNFGVPCETFTYSSNNACINLDRVGGVNKSVGFDGNYVNAYSAIFYHDGNCTTYLARYSSSQSDIGSGLYNQFGSMQLQRNIAPATTQQPSGDGILFCNGENFTGTCVLLGAGKFNMSDTSVASVKFEGNCISHCHVVLFENSGQNGNLVHLDADQSVLQDKSVYKHLGSVEIYYKKPPTASQVDPASGTTLSSGTTEYDLKFTGGDNYTVHIWGINSSGQPNMSYDSWEDVATQDLKITGLLPGMYAWQVRGANDQGAGNWSNQWTFSISDAVTPTPTPSPTDTPSPTPSPTTTPIPTDTPTVDQSASTSTVTVDSVTPTPEPTQAPTPIPTKQPTSAPTQPPSKGSYRLDLNIFNNGCSMPLSFALWPSNGNQAYPDSFVIKRDGSQIASVSGHKTSYADNPDSGNHNYEVDAIIGGNTVASATSSASC